jgi:hypothetical protein
MPLITQSSDDERAKNEWKISGAEQLTLFWDLCVAGGDGGFLNDSKEKKLNEIRSI